MDPRRALSKRKGSNPNAAHFTVSWNETISLWSLTTKTMLSQFFRSVFRFRKTTVSLLAVLSYLVLAALYVYDRIHYSFSLPTDDPYSMRLLDDAWLDLQNITSSYHPYASRDNDRVHDYLLSRISAVTNSSSSYIAVSDDYQTKRSALFKQKDVFNASSQDTRVIYYESSNILVKVEGSDPELPGLLLSAHYDSVPTAHGATDDGKGIVSLLALLTHYSKNQPSRTLIFNFNNNEEFGLLGATLFFSHQWSERVSYVLNLEGTGAGGKSVLFRTSDLSTASIYQQAVQEQPFGNSIYQQGFYNRYVGSETDYKVYEQMGLRGWDIAFYKPRDLYHTQKDSVMYTSREALWHMLHTSWQLSDYLTAPGSGSVEADAEDPSPAIYFDILGVKFVVFSAKKLYQWNCILLVVIPLIVLILQTIVKKRKTRSMNTPTVWLRLPASIAAAYLTLTISRSVLSSANPLIVSNDYLSPVLFFATQFIIVNYVLLSFFEFLSPTQDFKTIALLELSVALWCYLLKITIELYDSKFENTGVYPFTALYSFISAGTILGLFFMAFKPRQQNHQIDTVQIQDEEQQQQQPPLTQVQLQDSDTASVHSDNQPDERSPLLLHSTESSTNSSSIHSKTTTKSNSFVSASLNYDWSLQFLVVVPLATFFLFNNCLDLVLDALHQTCQESLKSTLDLSNFVMIGAIFVSIPLLPFTYKLNYIFGLITFATWSITCIVSLVRPAFTENSPLKLRFSQVIDLSNGTESSIVNIYGRSGGYIESVLKDLPSIKQSNKHIWCQQLKDGNEQCSYIAESPNLIDSDHALSSFTDVLNIEILSNNRKSSKRSPYEPITAELKINIKENRICTMSFNSSDYKSYFYGKSPLREVTIFHNDIFDNLTRFDSSTSLPQGYSKDRKGNEIFRWNSGIDEFQLHKLDFDQNYYHVGLQWIPKVLSQTKQNDDFEDDMDAFGIQLTCFWGEYDTESVVAGVSKRKVPAFDELLAYSPKYISYSNKERGMVAIKKYIEL